ncbi:MAG TPA: TIGR02300 family protein, partial [Methyloceanibacter sp.]
PEEVEVAPEAAETELVSLEDAEAEQQGKKKPAAAAGAEADVDSDEEDVEVDDGMDDATFIEEEEEGDEDVTDIIGDGIEKEDET